MRILFVEPVGTGLPPLGLLYLIGALKKQLRNSVEIDLISLKKNNPPYERSKKRLLKLLEKKPDICGITATTPVIINAAKIAKLAKKYGSYTIIGGPGATQLRERVLKKFPYIDMVFCGEGEETISDIVKRIAKEEYDFSDLQGPIFKKGKKIIETTQHPYIKDLDGIPFPDRNLLPFNSLHGAFSIMTQRGCPYNCSFCFKPVHGNLFRARSPENILEEIKYIIEKFPEEFNKENRQIVIADDIFNLDIERAKKILDAVIKADLKIKLVCVNGFHVKTVDKELFEKYKKAGGTVLWFGIDSGSEKILKNLGKAVDLDMVRKAVNLAKDEKIELVGAHFIIGLENETLKTARESIQFAKSLNLNEVGFNHANVLPETKLWEYATTHGKLLYWTDGIDFPMFQQLQPVPKFETPEFTKEEREKAFDEAVELMDHVRKRNTLKPKKILKFILSLRSLDDFIWALGRVKRYLTVKNLRLGPGKARPSKIKTTMRRIP